MLSKKKKPRAIGNAAACFSPKTRTESICWPYRYLTRNFIVPPGQETSNDRGLLLFDIHPIPARVLNFDLRYGMYFPNCNTLRSHNVQMLEVVH